MVNPRDRACFDFIGKLARAIVVAALLAGAATADIIDPLNVPASLALPSGVAEVERSVEQFRTGDFDGCQASLAAAVKRDQTLLPSRLLFAKVCLIHRRRDMARAALDRFAVEEPAHPEIPLILGRLALEDRRWTEATILFRVGLDALEKSTLPPDLVRGLRGDGFSGLAIASQGRSDWIGAEAAWKALIAVEPRLARAKVGLGEALFHRGNRDEALASFQKARLDDARLEPATLALARLVASTRPVNEAEDAFVRAAKGDPDDARTRLALAQFLAEQDRPAEAQVEAEAAGKLVPRSEDVRYLQGILALDRGAYAEAEAIGRSLHEADPGSMIASDLWASALVEQPDESLKHKAATIAGLNVRLRPQSAQARATLGWIEYRRGRLAEAEEQLRAALATGTASSDAVYALARVLSDRGRFDEAAGLVKAALEAKGRFRFRRDAVVLRDQLAKRPKINPPGS